MTRSASPSPATTSRPPVRRFDAVLFDFGGVFTESPFGVFEQAARELGAAPEHVLEIVFGPYDCDTDHPWHRLERGEISLMDARADIMSLGNARGVEIDPLRILARMATGGGAREPLVQRVRSLRREGYRTGLVTNNAREFREGWRGLLPLDELFDLVVDSSEIGCRKPDPTIFQHALQLAGGVAPERCIFLDDFAGNVRAAERLGMTGILVADDATEALATLDRLLS
jgi:putative hydrolase of the HAD superfamily